MKQINKVFLATLGLGLLAASAARAQQGVGTGATAPRTGTMLDVNGPIAVYESTVAATGTTAPTAAITGSVGQVQLTTGTATAGPITVSYAGTANAGQRLVIFNNATYAATFNSQNIPAGQAVEFVYSNSGWRANGDGGNSIAATNGLTKTGNAIGLGGALTSATAISNITSSNTLSFTSPTAADAAITIGSTAASAGRVQLGNANHGVQRGLTGSTSGAVNDVALYTSQASLYLVANPNTTGNTNLPLGQFTLTPAGNVGIGTIAPSTKLDVVGNARISTLATGAAADQLVTAGTDGTLNQRTVTSVLAGGTTHTLTSSGNTLTSTVNGVAATAPAVNSVANTSTANTLTTTVNGVAGANVPLINSNTLSNTNGTLTSTVNGVAATTPVLISANNGLTATNGNVQLGGALTQATSVSGITASNTLSFTSPTAADAAITVGNTANGSGKVFLGNANHGIQRDLTGSTGGSANDVAVYTSASNGTARLFLSANPGASGSTNLPLGQFTLLPSGNVGIGTVAPGTKLDVVGNARISALAAGAAADQLVTAASDGTLNQRTVSAVLAGGTTNTLSNTNGTLTSTVNGVAATTPVLIDAQNGLTDANGIARLGGDLTQATTVSNITSANTLRFTSPTAADAAITIGNTGSGSGKVFLGNSNHGLQRDLSSSFSVLDGTTAGSANDVALYTTNSGTGRLFLAANPATTGNTNLPLGQFTLNSAGYVGIGSPNPASKIQAVTTGGVGGADDDYSYDTYTGNGASASGIYYRHARGTAAAPANLANGDLLYTQSGVGYVNGAFAGLTFLNSYYTGNGTTSASYMNFGTSGAERLRITENGAIRMTSYGSNASSNSLITTTPTGYLAVLADGTIAQTANGNAPNIYTVNGSIIDDRTVTLNGHTINFLGSTGNFQFNATGNTFSTSANQLVITESGDQFGSSSIALRNRNAQNGLQVTTANLATGSAQVGVTDVFLQTQSANPTTGASYIKQGNLRYEARTNSQIGPWETTADSTEVQFLVYARNANYRPLVMGSNYVLASSPLGIGTGRAALTQAFEVAGTARIAGSSAISTQGAYLQWNRSGGNGETWLLNQRGLANTTTAGIRFGDVTTANVVTEYARFDYAGNFGIGVVTPAYKLHVNGDINASGTVRSNGTALTSDARLKRNITPLTNGLATVQQLHPVAYDKKATIASTDYNRHELGFIAQEVRKVLPTLVSEGKDADKTLALSYVELIPVLTEAIQEQQAQIEALNAANAKLTSASSASASTLSDMQKALQELRAEVQSLKAAGTTASTK